MFDAIGKLQELQAGLEAGKEHIGDEISAQQSAMDAIESPGVLEAKTKLLVAIGAIALARCDNCVVYCPQTAVFKVKKNEATTGRYVATDYDKCIGCHICHDVCPTGYIQMGLGE